MKQRLLLFVLSLLLLLAGCAAILPSLKFASPLPAPQYRYFWPLFLNENKAVVAAPLEVVACATFTSTGSVEIPYYNLLVPPPPPEPNLPATSFITVTTVAAGQHLHSFAVTLNVTGDLRVDQLVATVGREPNGEYAGLQDKLFTLPGGNQATTSQITNARFINTATRSFQTISNADAPFTGDWLPEEALDELWAEPNGTWYVNISSFQPLNGNMGELSSWTLTLCTDSVTPTPTPSHTPTRTPTITTTPHATPTFGPGQCDLPAGVHVWDLATLEAQWAQGGVNPQDCVGLAAAQIPEARGGAAGRVDWQGEPRTTLRICNLGAEPVTIKYGGYSEYTGWSDAGQLYLACLFAHGDWCDEIEQAKSAPAVSIGTQTCALSYHPDIHRHDIGGELTIYPFEPEPGRNIWDLTGYADAINFACPATYAETKIAVWGEDTCPTPTPTPTDGPRPLDVFPCNNCDPNYDWNLRSGCGTNDHWVGIHMATAGAYPGWRVAVLDTANATVCSRTLAADNAIGSYQRFYADEMLTPGGARCPGFPRLGTAALYNAAGTLVASLKYDSTDHCGEIINRESDWPTATVTLTPANITYTPTPSPTVTGTRSPTPTPSVTPTPSQTPTGTLSPTVTRPATYTPTVTPRPMAAGGGGLVVVRQWDNTVTPLPGQTGSHRDIYWNSVQARIQDQPNWNAVATRVAQLAGQGLKTWLSFNDSESVYGKGQDRTYVPVGVPTVVFTAGLCGTEAIPKYDDPLYRSAKATAIASMGHAFSGNANVEGIAIQAGMSGEAALSYQQYVWATPTPSGPGQSYACKNIEAAENAGVTCDEYIQYVKDLVVWYRQAFPTKELTLATGLRACSTRDDWRAIKELMDFAATYDVHYRYNGLGPDHANNERPKEGTPYPYGRLQYGNFAPAGAAFEPGSPFGFPQDMANQGVSDQLPGWADDMLFAGAGAGADYLFMQKEWWPSMSASVINVMTNTLGTDATNAPMVWIRFRDREWGKQGPANPNFTYDGYQGPFMHLARVVGVATPTQYCAPKTRATAVAFVSGGTPPAPCPQALNAAVGAPESRNNLQYAAAKSVGIDIADAWLWGGATPGDYQVQLTYLNSGTDTFDIVWKTAGGEQTQTVTKTNTNAWVTVTANLTAAIFNNGLPTGGDLEIRTGSGAELLHLITVAYTGGRGFVWPHAVQAPVAPANPAGWLGGLVVTGGVLILLALWWRVRHKK